MQYNGTVEVSAEALAVALSGRKIEAIKMVRDTGEGGAYVGLKDAKDAVEAAMSGAEPTIECLRVRIASLEQENFRLRTSVSDLSRQAQQVEYLQNSLRAAREARYKESDRADRLERAITEHVFGREPLPTLGVAPKEDDED
jgi:predicted RNase H-like nuclease (RuvC/YqgF family)